MHNGRKRSTALASLLHIPIRLRAKSLEQRPTLRTTQRRDLRECIGDHATARSDHHATLALPRPIAERIDDAADRLRKAFGKRRVGTGRSDRPAPYLSNLHEPRAPAQMDRTRLASERTQVAAGVYDGTRASTASQGV